MAEPWCDDSACWQDYAHTHLSALERLDFDDKHCGCGQAGCMETVVRAGSA